MANLCQRLRRDGCRVTVLDQRGHIQQGGSLALAYPGAELPLILTTLAATLRLRSPSGERCVPVNDFITGALETTLAEDEYIHSADIPNRPPGAGSVMASTPRTSV